MFSSLFSSLVRCLALGVALVTPLLAQQAAEPSPELGYRMPVGSSLRYRARSTTAGALSLRLASAEPHRIELATRLEVEMRLQFLEVRADALRVRQEIAWLDLSGEISGRAFAFDSRTPAADDAGEIYAPLYRSLRLLIGKPLDLEVGNRGRSVRYRAETLQALDQLGGLIQPEDLVGLLEAVFPPLPAASTLAEGLVDEWSRPVHLSTFGQVDLGVRSRVAALSPATASLALEFRPRLLPAPGTEAAPETGEARVQSGQSSGALELRRTDGATVRSQSSLELALTLREEDLEVAGSIRLGSEIELLPDGPAAATGAGR